MQLQSLLKKPAASNMPNEYFEYSMEMISNSSKCYINILRIKRGFFSRGDAFLAMLSYSLFDIEITKTSQ